MKARLPQGFSNGGGTNLQQLARQAQKLQEEMDAANSELELKEYSATVGGNAVTAVVTGKMEVKSLDKISSYVSIYSPPFSENCKASSPYCSGK